VHKRLVAVFEDGQVLELLEEDGNVVRTDEEACEKHEGNDEDGRQSDGQLLVREGGRDNQGVARASVVDQDQDSQEDQEGFGGWVVADCVVDDATKDHWGHDREGQL